MNSQRLEELAAFVVSEARRLGATACDVSISSSKGVEATVRAGEVEQLEGAQERELTFRAFVNKNSATTKSSDFRRRSLTRLVRNTIALARASEPDEFAGLPDKVFLATAVPDVQLFDSAVAKVTAEQCITKALALEAAALAADKRISPSRGASANASSTLVVYANSHGFVGSYVTSASSLSVSVVATEGEEMQTEGWGNSNRRLANLESPQKVGQEASRRALRRLGAKRVKSQQVPVIYDQQMAARLISQLAGAAMGDAIFRSSSFLVGKLGQQIASANLTVIDDALIPGGLASRPFSGEGLPIGKRMFVESGRLGCYFIDSYAGRKLNVAPNGGRPTNLYVQAGQLSPEQIIAGVKAGLYLTSISGPGFNQVTGDYSVGASGIWIEDGKLAFPVQGITIASNVLEMLNGIEAVGSDLEFRSSVNSPTLKIGSMMVAGA